MGKGKVSGRSPHHQEHGHFKSFEAPSCEVALQVIPFASLLTRSLLAEDAIKAAVNDYVKKSEKKKTSN